MDSNNCHSYACCVEVGIIIFISRRLIDKRRGINCSYGLKHVDSKVFFNNQHESKEFLPSYLLSKKFCKCSRLFQLLINFFLAIVAFLGANLMFQNASFSWINMAKTDTLVVICYYAMMVGTCFQQGAVWMIPTFVVRVLMKYFQNESMKSKVTLMEKCKTSLILYESLTNCFSYFFVCYFFILQLFSIFVTYLYFSTISHFTFTFYHILNFIGFILQLSCNTIWLISLTNSISKCSECIHDLKRELEETLVFTEQKKERQYLKYLIKRIRDLQPMHACGYFIVDKSTLTSMLSVR